MSCARSARARLEFRLKTPDRASASRKRGKREVAHSYSHCEHGNGVRCVRSLIRVGQATMRGLRTLGNGHIEGDVVELLRLSRLFARPIRCVGDEQVKCTYEYDA